MKGQVHNNNKMALYVVTCFHSSDRCAELQMDTLLQMDTQCYKWILCYKQILSVTNGCSATNADTQ